MINFKKETFLEDFVLTYLIFAKIILFFNLYPFFENFGIYSEFFEFIDIVVSFTGLFYVLYKSKLSEIFFGTINKKFDFILLSAYFILIINKFIEFMYVIASKGICVHQERLLNPIICFLANPFISSKIINISFYLGLLILFILSIYSTFFIKIEDKSILNALHEDNKTKKPIKFISVFILLIGFYLIFFNFISEWFTRILDAPILFLAILFYLIKYHMKKDSETILVKSSSTLEELIKNFINLFHDKKTIFLGISLILVFHLISDLAVFIIPYNLGVGANFNIEELEDENHKLILEHYKQDLNKRINPVILFFAYLFNTIGAFYLMFFPLFIWFVVYDFYNSKKQRNFSKILIALFFSCLVFMELMPTYLISSIYNKEIIGTDIKTQSVLSNNANLYFTFALSVIVFLFVVFISKIEILKEILFFLMTLISLGFFGIYIYYYYNSLFFFFLEAISFNLKHNKYFDVVIYFIYLMIYSLFYLGSYLSFLFYTFKEDKNIEPTKENSEAN
ncbi:MAG: hypothetical protein QXM96_01065 [Candidatus Woesearchaeota archaeon]